MSREITKKINVTILVEDNEHCSNNCTFMLSCRIPPMKCCLTRLFNFPETAADDLVLDNKWRGLNPYLRTYDCLLQFPNRKRRKTNAK